MVWSEQIGVSIVVPSDRQAGDGRNYIVIGEDVPPEIAAKFTAALVFQNGAFDATKPDLMYPNGFVYWAIGITATTGQLEIVGLFYTVSAPTGGGFTYFRQTVLSLAPPIGVDNRPIMALGNDINSSTYQEEGGVIVKVNGRNTADGGWKTITAAAGWSANPAKYRIIDGMCTVMVYATNAAGWARNTKVCDLPAEATPAIDILLMSIWSGVVREGYALHTGNITIVDAGAAGAGVSGVVSYPIG